MADSRILLDPSSLVLSRRRRTYIGIINPTDPPPGPPEPGPGPGPGTTPTREVMLLGSTGIDATTDPTYLGPANEIFTAPPAYDAYVRGLIAGPLPVGKLRSVDVRIAACDDGAGTPIDGTITITIYQSGLVMRALTIPPGVSTASDKGTNFWAEGGLFLIGIGQENNTVRFGLTCSIIFEPTLVG